MNDLNLSCNLFVIFLIYLVAIDMVRRQIYYLDPFGDNPYDELRQMMNE